jgi:hypothetical protein
MRRYLNYGVVLLLAGCAVLGSTPEAQIKSGADKLTAGTNLTTALLARDKITVAQAKSYRALLGTASSALDTTNDALLACRKRTASTPQTSPDPCKQTVTADLNLVTDILTRIETTLKAKE